MTAIPVVTAATGRTHGRCVPTSYRHRDQCTGEERSKTGRTRCGEAGQQRDPVGHHAAEESECQLRLKIRTCRLCLGTLMSGIDDHPPSEVGDQAGQRQSRDQQRNATRRERLKGPAMRGVRLGRGTQHLDPLGVLIAADGVAVSARADAQPPMIGRQPPSSRPTRGGVPRASHSRTADLGLVGVRRPERPNLPLQERTTVSGLSPTVRREGQRTSAVAAMAAREPERLTVRRLPVKPTISSGDRSRTAGATSIAP